MNIELVPYTKRIMELSGKWLNDEELRTLTNAPVFTKSEQQKWFQALHKQEQYEIWGIRVNQTDIGACGLKNITKTDGEYWGYIGEKKYWGKGIGSKVMELIIELAKQKNLDSIWLNVIDDNIRAIRLYEKYGFVKKNEQNQFVEMRLVLS